MSGCSYLRLVSIAILLGLLFSLTECKKDDETPAPATSAPTVTTSSASWVGRSWATLKGTVNANNYITKVIFEYDTTTSYSQTIDATPDIVTGESYTSVSANLTGLKTKTLYHYRIKAASSAGTTYGSDMTFTTTSGTSGSVIIYNPGLTYDSITDIEGNTYPTIQIGAQTWMAENLKTTKYYDGTIIPFVISETVWTELTTPAYSWYNNDSITYGALYNWHAVNTGKICPDGWHVPSESEWTILINYLGNENVAGDKLKETGTSHWLSPNTKATNESGFTALPGGYRNNSGTFNNIKRSGYWWSSTESSSADAYCRSINYSYSNVDRISSNKRIGLSVRCIED